MTRTDLENKAIAKLNSIDEALEMINLLDYDECISALNGLHDVPHVIFNALINRAKYIKGNTLELMIASMQCVVNE